MFILGGVFRLAKKERGRLDLRLSLTATMIHVSLLHPSLDDVADLC